MAEEGQVRLQNGKGDMVLKIVGRVPEALYASPPTVTIGLNGEQLDKFPAPKGMFEKEYTLTETQQGKEPWLDLRILTDAVAVPKDIDKKSSDARKLGFKIHELTWEPK